MIYQVISEPTRFVELIEYRDNKAVTTGGEYNREDIVEVDYLVLGITYCSAAATYLPFNWPYRMCLDDNNKEQHIKDIRFEESPSYVMEDGSLSWEVVIY